jgi:hypothetical protein
LTVEGNHAAVPAEENPYWTGLPDGCPPNEAAAANGKLFRVVRDNPPIADDLLTFVELDRLLPGRECECHGVSLFADIYDALQYADKFPYLGELIAEATLTADHGKTLPTPRNNNSHVTWWPYREVPRHELFVVVQEVEDVGG